MQTTDRAVFAPVPRHPLGLPQGSVRAVLSLTIVGLFWLLLLLPADKDVQIPCICIFSWAWFFSSSPRMADRSLCKKRILTLHLDCREEAFEGSSSSVPWRWWHGVFTPIWIF